MVQWVTTAVPRLLHRAQRMAQKGGRLRIASSQRTTPTPSEREAARAPHLDVGMSSMSQNHVSHP